MTANSASHDEVPEPVSASAAETVTVRRHVRAGPDRVFRAWTDPVQLVKWWGPPGTECIEATVDLRVGGTFRIGNQLPDGTVVWITGEYEAVDPPNRLRHTWQVNLSPDGAASTVTVSFEEIHNGTEVVVVHENEENPMMRESHEQGWHGCLSGLVNYFGD